MTNWTKTAKEEGESKDIFEKLSDAIEKSGLKADPEVVDRWLSDKTKLYFLVEPKDKYAIWDDLNQVLEIFSEYEFIERVKTILKDWETENPDLLNQIQEEIARLNADNVLKVYRMVKEEYWGGEARGWERFIPEGTKYIILETENRAKDGPRALFIKENPSKEIIFDKESY